VRALLRVIAITALQIAGVGVSVGASGAAPGASVLTNAAGVLNLTAVQAAQSLPVRLRGVVVDESQPRERAVIFGD
jgi:hypothetical protein